MSKTKKIVSVVFVLLVSIGLATYSIIVQQQKGKEVRFTGGIESVHDARAFDGGLEIVVNKKSILVEKSGLAPHATIKEKIVIMLLGEKGDVLGLPSESATISAEILQGYVGKHVEVLVAKDADNPDFFTIYGSRNYFIKEVE